MLEPSRGCVPVVRPIDRWFIEEVLPSERLLLNSATRLCGDPEEARDLVQDVLIRMLAIEGWSAITNPRAYMLRMMRNQAIDRARRAKIVDFQQLVGLEDFDLIDDAPDQHRVAEDRQALEAFSRAVEALPERCRIVFERCRIAGQSPKQIAAELGLSLSTLEKRLARALELLTQALEPRHGDRSEMREAEETPRQRRSN